MNIMYCFAALCMLVFRFVSHNVGSNKEFGKVPARKFPSRPTWLPCAVHELAALLLTCAVTAPSKVLLLTCAVMPVEGFRLMPEWARPGAAQMTSAPDTAVDMLKEGLSELTIINDVRMEVSKNDEALLPTGFERMKWLNDKLSAVTKAQGLVEFLIK